MIWFTTAIHTGVLVDFSAIPSRVHLYRHTHLPLPEENQRPPLLDRIDIHVEVPRVDYENLADKRNVEDSKTIRAYHRVLKPARTIADLAGSEMIMANYIAEQTWEDFTLGYNVVK